jgi:hypothetical protein
MYELKSQLGQQQTAVWFGHVTALSYFERNIKHA